MSPANQSTHGQPHEGKYVAYVRVSTNKQDTERDEKDIRDFLGNKIENVTWYKENIVVKYILIIDQYYNKQCNTQKNKKLQ